MVGSDGVRQFLQAASENENASAQLYAPFLDPLDRIDRAFREIAEEVPISGEPLAGLLFLNSRASFLAAVRLALSGQSPPTFMALRGCIESALYALIANASEKNAEVWMAREKNLQACRKLYTATNGLKLLGRVDHNLKNYLSGLYEGTIDYGAHPNKLSLIRHLRIEQEEEHGVPVSLIILHGPKSEAVLQAIVACIETGIGALSVAPHALPGHEEARSAHREAWQVYDHYKAMLVEQGHIVDGPAEVQEPQ